MTQENKELLLKDLCARLPYGVVIQTWYHSTINIKCISVNVYTNVVELDIPEDDSAKVYIDNVKPYLFPLSSMTEEQKAELMELMYKADTPFGAIFSENIDYFDWLNKHHFDYRGLIPMGLAEDATDKNIY